MTLLGVRHGQASYGSEDYDRLSELGWQQVEAVMGREVTHLPPATPPLALSCDPSRRS